MKTKTLISALIIGTFLLCSCGSSNRKQQDGDLPVINLTGNHPRKEIRIQDIAVVEYIPLETTDDVLLGQSSFLSHISDKYIVVFDLMLGNIFVFNRNGRIMSHFNHRGQGPMEYANISDVVFDENTGEIFVFDSWSHRILVYSINGEYKRTLRIPPDLFLRVGSAANFDNETILVYDAARLAYPDGHIRNKRPYMLLSKRDGSIVYSFNIKLPIRYLNRIAEQFETNGEVWTFPIEISTPNNKHFGRDFVIANISSDTIFLLTQDRVLTPLFVRRPSIHSSVEPRRVLTTLLKTDKFIVLRLTTLDFDAARRGGRAIPPIFLIHEFETGKTSEVSFMGEAGPWMFSFGQTAIGKNMDAVLVPAFVFTRAYENNRLPDELKPLAASLDEEDNPVVRIVTFK